MDQSEPLDPFATARAATGVLDARFDDEPIPMILGHKAVRRAASDWQTFSSDAPMRVPIPSEEGVRTMRQLPIEADPPLHTTFRKLLNPLFLRPVGADYLARLDALVVAALDAATAAPRVEIVRDFALPLQSRALALLLGMPQAAAEEWISWGCHVFHDVSGEDQDSAAKGQVLDRYLRRALAEADPEGADFFAFLNRAEVAGRKLTFDAKLGIANLTFAGGRDTVIHAISRIIAWFADQRAALDAIHADPKACAFAVEEFVRIISPLTHIGRVCPHPTEVGGIAVPAGARVSLCWASANHDETVFDRPHEVRLDRAPNPHLGFGSGHHACLGAAQARALLRRLIHHLGARTSTITIHEEVRQYDAQPSYRRWVGYETLVVTLAPRG